MKKKFYLTGGILLAVFVALFVLSIFFKWDIALFPAGIMAVAVMVAFFGSTRKKDF